MLTRMYMSRPQGRVFDSDKKYETYRFRDPTVILKYITSNVL